MVDSSLFGITPLHLAGLYLTFAADQHGQENTGSVSQKRSSEFPSHAESGSTSHPRAAPSLGTGESASMVRSPPITGEEPGPPMVRWNKLHATDHAGPFSVPTVIEKQQLAERSGPQ